MTSDAELRALLVATFKSELDEYVATLNPTLIELERVGMREDLVHNAFRTVHNLKGAAGAVGLATVAQIAHHMENLLGAVRRGELTLSQEGFDLCYQGIDLIQSVVETEIGGGTVPAQVGGDYEDKVSSYLRGTVGDVKATDGKLTAATEAAQHEAAAQPAPTGTGASPVAELPSTLANETVAGTPLEISATFQRQTVRIPLAKLDRLTTDVSKLLVSKNQYEDRARDIQQLESDLAATLNDWGAIQDLQRKLRRIGVEKDVERLLDKLEVHQTKLKTMQAQVQTLATGSSTDGLKLDMCALAVQHEVNDLRMVPIGTIFAPLRRAARKYARKHKKNVIVDLRGRKTELDRKLLEATKDPIKHILRNIIDRRRADQKGQDSGKPPGDHITLAAKHQGNQIVVEISDRAGINLDADRGLGLDAVKSNVERLQGKVEAEAIGGEGTTFRITLPLTLSTMRVLLVRTAGQIFAIPVDFVERTTQIRPDSAFTVESQLAISLDSRAVTLMQLDSLLGFETGHFADRDSWTVFVVHHGGERTAFVIDEILGEQELMIKPLEEQSKRSPNISGGAVMRDGSVVHLLNPSDLLRSARGKRDVTAAHEQEAESVRRKILVVDDSITTRTLEKNILESAGFEVILAKDGDEGFDLANSSGCELVIADIEMPGLNGFELTHKIKTDKELGRLPVILVSSLDSPQFKAKGAQAGADAYIVKGQFNQGHFLDVVSGMLESRYAKAD